MKRKSVKRVVSMMLTGALALSAMGCGSKAAVKEETTAETVAASETAEQTTETKNDSTEKTTLRMDVVSSGTQAIPAYVMQKKGLADKYGIDLQIHDNSGAWGSEWTAMKTDEIDCMITAWTYVAMNYAETPTVCAAPMFGWGNSVITGSDSGINGLSDLTGIKLGVYQTTALDWVLMRAACEKDYGFDPNDTCEVSEAAAGLLGGMLQQGNIDAALSYADTNVILGAEDDYKVIFNMGDCLDTLGLDKNTPFLFYTFSQKYYEKHPETVAAFADMYGEVYDILMEDDDIWNDIAADLFGVTDESAVPALRDEIRSCILKNNTADTEKECKDMLQWCVDNGYEDMIGISEIPDGIFVTE